MVESNYKLYFKLHAAGIINQVLSVELGLCLGFLLQRKVIFTKFICIADAPIAISGNKFQGISKLIEGSHKPLIFDIMDLPLKMFDFGDKTLAEQYKHDYGSLIHYYYQDQETTDSFAEEFFAEGRKKLLISNENVYLDTDTISTYSRFFFNRSKKLDSFISTLKFQDEYQELAKKIADSIGPFKGMHVRLTDHAEIMFTATEERFNKGLVFLSDDPLPLVICTDDHSGYLEKYKKTTIMLDQYIIKNFEDEFRELPYHDLTVFGVICLLVMSYAKEFVGTPGSTYTGYIQRLRLNRGLEENFYFIDDPDHPSKYHKTGPYNWNGFAIHPCTKAWWREWPECKLDLN